MEKETKYKEAIALSYQKTAGSTGSGFLFSLFRDRIQRYWKVNERIAVLQLKIPMKKPDRSSKLTDVTKMTIRRVSGYTIQSNQVLKTRIKKAGNEEIITIIKFYAPQSGKLIANCDELDDLYGSFKKPPEQFAENNNYVFICRDFNAKVEKNDGTNNCLGRHSRGIRNTSG